MRIWDFSVRRWQFTLVLFGLLIAVGVNAYLDIPRSEDPEFHAPIPTVVAVYPGADPEDIESLVVDPIEDAINELDDIKRMESRSMDGVGVIQIEFHWHTDPDEKYDEVVREVNRIRGELPAELASLEIRKAGSGLVNIVQMALVSEDASYRELEKLAEDLKDSIETAPGVRRSETWAFPEPEVRIAIDLERMGRAGVTLGQVEAAVRGENASIPGGAVDVGLRKFNVKTSGSYDTLDEIEQTVVASRGGRLVMVRDVADVAWDTAEESYTGRYNGRRAVFVTANAKDKVDVFAVRDAIYQRVAAFERELPEGVTLERGFDQTRNVQHRLSKLGIDFAIAIGLVLLTLLPLGVRASLVVMISIPLSLAIGLALLHFTGFSLNQLSIAGFVLALGLLVDDSIVVVENISRYLRSGYSRVEAAIAATDQIALAVIGCTATLLFAFLPLLFLPEGAGIFIRSLPAAVLYTVLASLLVALTVIPFLSSRLLSAQGDGGHGNRALKALMAGIHRIYSPALGFALAHPRRTLVAALVFTLAALGLVPVIGTSVFPQADIPQFRIAIETPDGASINDTDRALRFVESELARHEEVRHVFAISAVATRRSTTTSSRKRPTPTWPTCSSSSITSIRAVPRNCSRACGRPSPSTPAHASSSTRMRTGRRSRPPSRSGCRARTWTSCASSRRRCRARSRQHRAPATSTTRCSGSAPTSTCRWMRARRHCWESHRWRSIAPCALRSRGRRRQLPRAGRRRVRLDAAPAEEGRPTLAALDMIEVASNSGRQVPLRQLADTEFATAPSLIRRTDRLRGRRSPPTPGRVQHGRRHPGRARAAGERVAAGRLLLSHRRRGLESQEAFGGFGPAVLVAIFGMLAVLVLEFGTFRSTLSSPSSFRSVSWAD